MGWGELATCGVDVRVCRGDHETILEEENVGEAAEELKDVLERLSPNGTANALVARSEDRQLTRTAPGDAIDPNPIPCVPISPSVAL
jgi:hypothetical protein